MSSKKPVALVTGACGEMGHLLLPALAERGYATVAVDLTPLPPALAGSCLEAVQASILDAAAMKAIVERHHPELVFHLAAILSTKAEREPDLATDVNVGGTHALMRLCREDAKSAGRDVRFLFPSSIAVYGLPDRETKAKARALREEEWTHPLALYGIHKLECELLGAYFTRRARRERTSGLDFRSIRFPGLISADTVPSGGTSDYGPEMMHAAAQGKPYECFVRPDTRLPFMSMSEAVEAFLRLAWADASTLTTRVYNVRSWSASAEEIAAAVRAHYPDARVTYAPAAERQAIVDSWPGDVDDARARRDWKLAPKHDLASLLVREIVPALQKRYVARATS